MNIVSTITTPVDNAQSPTNSFPMQPASFRTPTFKVNDETIFETATHPVAKRSCCQIILPLLAKSDCSIMAKSSIDGSDKFSIRHLPAHSFTVGGHCKSDNQIMGLPNLTFFLKFSTHSASIHHPHAAAAT